MPEAQKITRFGFYSAKYAKSYGSVFWSKPDGGEVEVTYVESGQLPPHGKSNYEFDDVKPVGEIVEFRRFGQFRAPGQR